jgi:molybdopterin molybdotransferase
MDPLISLEEAQSIIRRTVPTAPIVHVPLNRAFGCVLAQPICSDIDSPPFDKAMMDGYAVRAADVANPPVDLSVIGQVAAGDAPGRSLAPGEALQINTGAMVPPGCDAVIRVEDTERHENRVRILIGAAPGRHIEAKGHNLRSGDEVLQQGTVLGPPQIAAAAAAAAGAATLPVFEVPRVAILVTGNELVEPQVQPQDGQIRDSNRYLLDGLIREMGCQPLDLGIGRDEPEDLIQRIKKGLQADVLCLSGGVSMGAFDFVPDCLRDCGVEVKFHKVALKPGKPVLFGLGPGGTCVFGLPGNPVSVFATFWLLVAPAIRWRQGRACPAQQAVRATLAAPLPATSGRRTYRPATIEVDETGTLNARPVAWGGSADIFGLARADSLIETAPDTPQLEPGTEIRVILLRLP